MPKIPSTTTLADLVWTDDTYSRSTNIELDYRDPVGVPGYKFTAKSLNLLEDVLESRYRKRGERAWSVVGPYGSGKSTFGLLLLQLLTNADSPWLKQCLADLEVISPLLAKKVADQRREGEANYLPVVLSGSKIPLDLALCQALYQAATNPELDNSWVSDGFLDGLHRTLETLGSGISDARATWEIYQQAAQLARIAGYQGLLVIVDEFGKFLERSAWQGELPDLLTAQYLAELASSSADAQVLFVVMLHQGFQHYASSLSRRQWQEWAKIQGRFQQVDFTEDPDNLYDLIAASLKQKNWTDADKAAVTEWSKSVWQRVRGVPVFQREDSADFWPNLLTRVYPFHPLALYALPRLSAGLGQNERTVFNFLASDDPLGFKRFLRNTVRDGMELPSLTLDYLFDYFLTGSRFALLPPDAQRRISEIDAALDRLGDRHPMQVRLLKTLGALSILRDEAALPATEGVVLAALGVDSDDEIIEARRALEDLVTRKIVVFRKFSGEFKIWQGSDFDFDGALAKSKEELEGEFDLSVELNRELLPRSISVHRHSFEKGTFRHFPVNFRSANAALKSSPEERQIWVEENKGDGLVVYLIPSSLREWQDLQQWVQGITEPRLLFVIPREPLGVASLTQDLSALRHVQTQWPELQDDLVAMKELAGRIDAMEEFLRGGVESLTEPTLQGAVWNWNGCPHDISSSGQLNRLLSQICDEVFPATPTLRNELINRQSLSTTVVSAVKRIIGGLLEANGDANLGFSGNGPEVSIFRAVFIDTGLYRLSLNGRYELCPPAEAAEAPLQAIWQEIDSYLRKSSEAPQMFLPLYQSLSAPPYGLRRGLIPLLIWAVLIYRKSTVSLYDNGTYLREWSPESFDLFVKAPENFTVRWLEVADSSQELLERLYQAVQSVSVSEGETERITISGFLQEFFGWYYQLPDFSKRTLRISGQAKELRQVLTTAIDPIELLLTRLPKSLGLRPLESLELETGMRGVHQRWSWYARKLKGALEEINGAYPVLCNEMVITLSRSFDLRFVISEVRTFFRDVDPLLVEHVGDSNAKAFFLRARDEQASDIQWLESLGAVLTNQAPRFWMDHHFEEFQDKVALVSVALKDAERRRFARMKSGIADNTPILRILVEGAGGPVVEEYLSDQEKMGEPAGMAQTLLQHLDFMAPDLPARYKKLVLARALGLIPNETVLGDVV